MHDSQQVTLLVISQSMSCNSAIRNSRQGAIKQSLTAHGSSHKAARHSACQSNCLPAWQSSPAGYTRGSDLQLEAQKDQTNV
jgi:hypothetical protein